MLIFIFKANKYLKIGHTLKTKVHKSTQDLPAFGEWNNYNPMKHCKKQIKTEKYKTIN